MARALGTDDSVTTCDCCGKCNLKFTVVIEMNDGGLAHYGQVCAGRNTGKSKSQIASEIKAYAAAKKSAALAEWKAHPAYIAERARFAQRDEFARRTGARMVGREAMAFVQEACEAADAARAVVAAKYGMHSYELLG